MDENISLINIINKIRLIKGSNIPYKDFADALAIQPASVNKRLSRNAKITKKDLELLENYFGINNLLETSVSNKNEDDCFKLRYYENKNLTKLITNPLIEYINMDYNIVKMWHLEPSALRIIAMPGDKMEGSPNSQLCIRNRDVLLMNTASTDINMSGIYAYETLEGTKLQISYVAVMTNSNIRFYYSNSLYPDEVRTEQDLKNLKFKVIGRIIKNLSYVHI